ncbi:hypothetical protein [Persicitalea sp.]|uniref:hypothetical protein n=1 Tax=Persicitalea sp. TaxID=3100273 RepID=UPI0035937930
MKGYEANRGVLGLRRHAAERNDIELDAYIRESVSEADYRKWSDPKTRSVEDSHASDIEK